MALAAAGINTEVITLDLIKHFRVKEREKVKEIETEIVIRTHPGCAFSLHPLKHTHSDIQLKHLQSIRNSQSFSPVSHCHYDGSHRRRAFRDKKFRRTS